MDNKLRILLRKYLTTEDPLDAVAFTEASAKKEQPKRRVDIFLAEEVRPNYPITILAAALSEKAAKQLIVQQFLNDWRDSLDDAVAEDFLDSNFEEDMVESSVEEAFQQANELFQIFTNGGNYQVTESTLIL